MRTLKELFEDQVKDLFSAESQLTKALPKMAKKATAEGLQQGLQEHLEQTQHQIERLEQIAQECGFKISGKKCKAMEGLIAEAEEVMSEKGEPYVMDAGIIASAQRVEHYEISSYGTAAALADQLGLSDAAEVLREILEEERETDERLTDICMSEVFSAAPQDDEDDEMEEDEDEEEEAPTTRRQTKGSTREPGRTGR